LAQQLQEGGSAALLLMDLDRFKAVNELQGHAAGNEVLRLVAERLAEALPGMNTLARLGDDEFVVLLPNTDSRGGLAVAERIQRALRERCLHRPQEAAPEFVTASIGIASLQPRAGQQPERLLALADAALYRAKAAGRDTCCL
jgi:diguanylate cyclase (GGDEF)-like protein